MGLLLGLVLAPQFPTSPVQAQETGKTPAAAPAAPPAAAPAGAPPAKDGAPAEQRSMLSWIIESSGWIGAIILLLSIYFVATVLRLFMELKLENSAPSDLIAHCYEMVQSRQLGELQAVVREDDTFFSKVVSAGMNELPNGLPEARDAMDRVGDVLVVEMEQNISMLAVLGTLGPMIGLLGTLKGMITSFSVIALSGTQLKASEVAGGISEALLLTFEGVGLAVPAIYFFALFRNRVARISSETLLRADELIRAIHAVRKKPKGPGSPEAPAATPAPQ
ncbi:MAG: MotA/TolQ/ExbB proton channel family protein [Planctomycetales bacterium]